MDRGIWWATVHWVTESQAWQSIQAHSRILKSVTILLNIASFKFGYWLSNIGQLFKKQMSSLTWIRKGGFWKFSFFWNSMDISHAEPGEKTSADPQSQFCRWEKPPRVVHCGNHDRCKWATKLGLEATALSVHILRFLVLKCVYD